MHEYEDAGRVGPECEEPTFATSGLEKIECKENGAYGLRLAL